MGKQSQIRTMNILISDSEYLPGVGGVDPLELDCEVDKTLLTRPAKFEPDPVLLA